MPPKAPRTKSASSGGGGHVGRISTGSPPVNKHDEAIKGDEKGEKSIEQSLKQISQRLEKLDEIEKITKEIKDDLWGDEGAHSKIRNVAELAENNETDIQELREENADLRYEVDMLKSIVIKLDRKLTLQSNQITDLKSRSMRDNILIHNYKEEEEENLLESIPADIKKNLGITVELVRIHRNGHKNSNKKPRTITAKLADRQKKFEIMNAQRLFKKKANDTGNENLKLPFTITPQSPPEVYEKRKKLEDISFQYRDRSTKTKFVGDKLVFEDGSTYRDKVAVPRAEDILYINKKEGKDLDKLKIKTSKSIVDEGNKFVGNGMAATTMEEVRKVYKKVCADSRYSMANHNILVYVTDEEEGYCDDGEWGAGKRLLKKLREKGEKNIAVVVSRWHRGQHIGPKRFSLMEQALTEAVKEIHN